MNKKFDNFQLLTFNFNRYKKNDLQPNAAGPSSYIIKKGVMPLL